MKLLFEKDDLVESLALGDKGLELDLDNENL
jgi:hypothetical protein